MSHKEEQIMEVEALESIFPNEIESIIYLISTLIIKNNQYKCKF